MSKITKTIKTFKKNKANKTIILIANSSWYLFHYRSKLISQIKNSNFHPIAIAPKDKFSDELSNLCQLVQWKIPNKNSLNIFSLIKPFFDILTTVIKLKPYIIHSHTIKANFFVSFIAYFLNHKSVLSFAGLGSLSTKNGLQKMIFVYILKTIYIVSTIEKKGFYLWLRNYNRTIFIFQNIRDKSYFEDLLNLDNKNKQSRLISGSGVPNIYVQSRNSVFIREKKINTNNLCFIYCARLLRSKGIIDFLELSRIYKKHKFFVYGEIDLNSKDSITKSEYLNYKSKLSNVFFQEFKSNPLLNHQNDQPILIIPSSYGEGFPRAIAEAICLGFPVIASEHACASHFNRNQVFMTKNCDAESLKKQVMKIKKFIKNDQLRELLIDSKKFIENNYTEDLVVSKTLEIYAEI